MKFSLYILVILVIQNNCITENHKFGSVNKNLNLDSIYNEFMRDTGNKQKLIYCDSVLYLSFQSDSLNVSILKKLKVTRLYLSQFDFVLNRIYPKLYTNDRLKDYEFFRFYELMKDSIQYCVYLNKAKESLQDIDFNNSANIEYTIAYLDLIYVQKGEEYTQDFILNTIKNDSILSYPFYLKNFNLGAKKWHTNVYPCK